MELEAGKYSQQVTVIHRHGPPPQTGKEAQEGIAVRCPHRRLSNGKVSFMLWLGLGRTVVPR